MLESSLSKKESVRQYALELVLNGAESYIDDDTDENAMLEDSQELFCAKVIATAIKEYIEFGGAHFIDAALLWKLSNLEDNYYGQEW